MSHLPEKLVEAIHYVSAISIIPRKTPLVVEASSAMGLSNGADPRIGSQMWTEWLLALGPPWESGWCPPARLSCWPQGIPMQRTNIGHAAVAPANFRDLGRGSARGIAEKLASSGKGERRFQTNCGDDTAGNQSFFLAALVISRKPIVVHPFVDQKIASSGPR